VRLSPNPAQIKTTQAEQAAEKSGRLSF